MPKGAVWLTHSLLRLAAQLSSLLLVLTLTTSKLPVNDCTPNLFALDD